ncbi:Abi family protein [Paralysiella testudinis]|uniref:Abi family protein n=1 Tax=Paralysiella testudinis TaxID=2809020 RepID=A0A892ZN86_9NEIS|nr:Abi family protein [Paralysiella testudinis]QRQ82299.1 Abi family protein [Paralysiella testudinis]
MTEKRVPKVWKSFDEQLALLQDRGLHIHDEKLALGYLKSIGYYRLSGYLYAFRQIDPQREKSRRDEFIAGSRFEDVKQLYVFDKKLRQLALDALERIEIALRVNIAYLLGQYSPIAYKNAQYFNQSFQHDEWLRRYEQQVNRESKSALIQHHFKNYTDLPIWAGCEVWDFGTMSKLFQGMLSKDKDRIAKLYHLQHGQHLQTHLHAFNFIRNISAHHSRLWNKPIVFKANMKGLKDAEWKNLSVDDSYLYFCLMKRMLDIICPNSTWGERFLATLDEFPEVENGAVSLQQMGVVHNPRVWELWQKGV